MLCCSKTPPHHFQSVPMRTPKGERLFDVIKSPVRGADGQIDHILTITRDMTEHRLAADKWRLASRVMEETGDAIVISDALDRILMVNPAFCRLSGMSPSEVTGRNAELIGLMPLRESHLQGIDLALKTNQRWAGIRSRSHKAATRSTSSCGSVPCATTPGESCSTSASCKT